MHVIFDNPGHSPNFLSKISKIQHQRLTTVTIYRQKRKSIMQIGGKILLTVVIVREIECCF